MATTPTDDPLADSDRTVGVNWELDSRNILKSLKREALLFDQIGIPNPGLNGNKCFTTAHVARKNGTT
jgi:hypothetical protein